MTHYMIQILTTGQIERRPFLKEHFREAGFQQYCLRMPVLEAHELVNKWNRNSLTNRQFIYWLE